MPEGSPVNLSGGLPETVLPPEAPDVQARLAAAMALPEDQRRAAVAEVVADHPRSLTGWAAMGDLAAGRMDAYACYRVGYHRGLDSLRANGWRGAGYVRWAHESNRGFLRSLQGLGRVAAEIGEADEATRCRDFFSQLAPDA